MAGQSTTPREDITNPLSVFSSLHKRKCDCQTSCEPIACIICSHLCSEDDVDGEGWIVHGDHTRERLGEVWKARDRAVDPLIPSLSSRTMREYLEKQLVPYYKPFHVHW